MNSRARAVSLISLIGLAPVSGHAQGLRISPQLGGGGLTAPAAGNAPALPSTVRDANYIMAVVNTEPVTSQEVRARMLRIERQLSQQGASLPPRDELARQVLERVIVEKTQLQLAQETGVRVEEAAVDQAEENFARQNEVTVAELRRRVVAEGSTLAQFREELRQQLLLTRVRDRELASRVTLNDLEVDQFIREQQGLADAPDQEINLAMILVGVPEDATEPRIQTLRERAERLLARARAGEDFGQLAREDSDSRERANGGVLGLRPADRYPQLFVDVTKSLRVGAVSDIVRSPAGFHILKVLEKSQAGLPGAVVIQNHARHILLRTGPNLSETEARDRLAEIKRRIEAGQADFAAVARDISQDGTARSGGDLGWANPGQFVPEFENAMNTLKPGQIGAPLISRFGVHLIQLIERRETTLSQREQRDIARGLLREKKLDAAYVDWAQEVRARAYVEYREPPR